MKQKYMDIKNKFLKIQKIKFNFPGLKFPDKIISPRLANLTKTHYLY